MEKKNMRKKAALIVIIGVVSFTGCRTSSESSLIKSESLPDKENTRKLIELEGAALERWSNGDPTGYLELYADDFTYFDESNKDRVDGRDAITKMYAPAAGKIYNIRFEMLNPKVQWFGTTGILTFNLLTYSQEGNVISREKSTEVYAKFGAEWKIVHSHWSSTKH